MLQSKVKDDDIHVNIWSGPTSPYLTDEILTRADVLFDRAEKLADDAEILQRVLVARLPIWYVRITRPGLSSAHGNSWPAARGGRANGVGPRRGIRAPGVAPGVNGAIMEVARKKGIDQICEGRAVTSWEQEMRASLGR